MHYKKNFDLSRSVWTIFDPKEDVARQEFKADCDLLTLLKRYGALHPARSVVYGGDVDFDVQYSDIVQAQSAVEHAAADSGVSPETLFESVFAPNRSPEASGGTPEGSGDPPNDSAGVGGA